MRQSRDIESFRIDCVYESKPSSRFTFLYKLLFHIRISSNIAAFDISIPRLTKDSFEMSFMLADILAS